MISISWTKSKLIHSIFFLDGSESSIIIIWLNINLIKRITSLNIVIQVLPIRDNL